MPSNYRRFAVNRSHGERVNLWTDWNNIFASVANFLQQYGWQAGAGVVVDARLLDG